MEVLIDNINNALCALALNKKGQLDALELDPELEQVRHGTIYLGRVDRIDATQNCAYIDLAPNLQGYLNAADARHHGNKSDQPLSKWLNNGDLILVQAQSGVINPYKNALNTNLDYEQKLTRLTMDVTLHGRYTLYAPYKAGNQISRRISDKTLRRQLDEMLTSEEMSGAILRAASAHTQTDLIIKEYRLLSAVWQNIINNLPIENNPQPVLAGPDAIMRLIANLAIHNITRIEAVGSAIFDHTQNWCAQFAPDLVPKIMLSDIHPQSSPEHGLLDQRDLLTPIEDLCRPYALLENGGSLIIEPTAALTAIDVNRGGASGSAADMNISAAREAMRQIRLRNLSGIIVIDFLKIKKPADKKKLISEIDAQAALDPYTVQNHGLTKLGLLELTRAQRTPPLSEKIDSIIAS